MNVALVQMSAGANKAENIDKALWFIDQAAAGGAQFVLLPEVFSFRGVMTANYSFSIGERIPGESIQPMMDKAKEKKIFILAGSIYEKSKNPSKFFNTSVLIGPDGKIKAKYRKIHLFDAFISGRVIKESAFFHPGKFPELTKIKNFSVGLSICYDLRFPELYRRYARYDVHIICVPSAFTRRTGQAHWEPLLRARAIENSSYVLAPNQIGEDSRGIESYGNSMIVDPWGTVLARGSDDKEEIIYSEISMDTIQEIREVLPALKNKLVN